MLERMWRNRNAYVSLVGMLMSSTVVESSIVISKNLKTEIPFDPAIPLLDLHPKKQKLFHHKDACTHMFIVPLLTITKTWNQPKCPSMVDWITKMWYI